MTDNREHKVKTDYGLTDYYRSYSKGNKQKVSRSTFGKIIKDFNGQIRDNISTKGNGYTMPCNMGEVQLVKRKTQVTVDKDGNIKNNMPVNWTETGRLWSSNESAFNSKTKIRYTNEHTEGYTFRIRYLKSKANYNNKSIYRMQFNRELKRQLSKSIFEGTIDAFIRK